MTIEVLDSSLRTVALVVGGIWVAWTFQRLQRTRAAEVTIEKDRVDIEGRLAESRKAAAELLEIERRRLSEQPSLDVRISELVEHRMPGTGRAYLAVLVTLRNSGALNLELLFGGSPLTVGRYDLADAELRRLQDVQRVEAATIGPVDSDFDPLPARIIRAGQEREMAFLARSSGPGIYFVQFQGLYRRYDLDDTEDSDDLTINAVQQRIVVVGADESSTLIPTPAP